MNVKYFLVIVYLILTVSGLVFMKLGGNPGTIQIKENNLNLSMNTISAIGFLCYICSFLIFTRIVVIFDLSYIFPICTGIVQIATMIASYYVFSEKISVYGVIGASFIIVGLIIMNIKITPKDRIAETGKNNIFICEEKK